MIINPSKQIGYIMKMYRLTDGHLIYHTPGHFSYAYSMRGGCPILCLKSLFSIGFTFLLAFKKLQSQGIYMYKTFGSLHLLLLDTIS